MAQIKLFLEGQQASLLPSWCRKSVYHYNERN